MQVNHKAAAAVFDKAVALAESGAPLPDEWLGATREVGKATSKTLVAMLGTALLARAVEPRVDPLTLKASAEASPGLAGYSARTIAKDVLVPCAVQHGVHLGVTGREPLNNQPFYAEDRVHRDMPTRPADREHLERLVGRLEQIAQMTAEQALEALAAFIAVRQQVAADLRPTLEIGGRATTLPALIAAVKGLITTNPEGGRRGQAFVAAALDMAFDDVVTSRVNDPSRHGPGDVRAFADDDLRLAAEVKQKPVTETDVLLFAQALAAWPLPSGIYVALDPTQAPLPKSALNEQAIDLYGAGVQILESVADVFAAIAVWGLRSTDDVIERFPQCMLDRMDELEVSVEARREWAQMFD